ncbi:MAG TPA: universal stress protein [Dehalococcoidia bacterium]|nr:universal stress protein [Dehalococcoidia bacterium]
MDLTTILVPTDGSRTADRSLPYAAALANLMAPAEIVLLTVLPLRNTGETRLPPPDHDNAEAFVRGRLAAAARRLRRRGVSTVHTEVLWNLHEDEAILAASRERDASLIVMGTHGRSGLSRALLGSTTMSVLQHAECPVVVVPPGARVGELQPRRILLPLDGSPESEQALPLAQRLAGRGVRVSLLRVVPTASATTAWGGWGETYAPPTWLDEAVSAAEDYLRDIAITFPPGQATIAAVIEAPAHAITQRAKEEQVDLILMTTHARSTLGRAFLGSVADRVVRSANVPVMLVRPKGTKT